MAAEAQKTMTLRLPADEAKTLKVIADVDGLSMSETVREAIANHINSRCADDGFQQRLAASMERHRRILDRLAG